MQYRDPNLELLKTNFKTSDPHEMLSRAIKIEEVYNNSGKNMPLANGILEKTFSSENQKKDNPEEKKNNDSILT